MTLNVLVPCKAEQARTLDDQRTARLAAGTLHLFTNNLTVTRDTVLSNFTEAAWTGYTSQSLSTWSAVAELGDGAHVETHNTDSPTFLNSSGSPVTFYGYYLRDGSGNYLMAANVGAVSIPAGASETVVVQVTQKSETTSSP